MADFIVDDDDTVILRDLGDVSRQNNNSENDNRLLDSYDQNNTINSHIDDDLGDIINGDISSSEDNDVMVNNSDSELDASMRFFLAHSSDSTDLSSSEMSD